MFRGFDEHIVVISANENNKPCLNRLKYSDTDTINLIKENAESSDLFKYFDKYLRFEETSCYSRTRFVVSTDSDIANITLFHNNVVLKTTKHAKGEIRFVATGDLIGLDCLTYLNDLPIKKVCVIGGKYKIGILSECGKLFLMNSFDSDQTYDLTSLQTLFPNEEKIVDINCTYNSIIALTDTSDVYNIYQRLNNKNYPIDLPVKISEEIGHVAEIGCHLYHVIMKTCDGNFYFKSDYRNSKLDAFNGFNIVKFDCNDYYTVALDDKGDLYTHHIEEYGFDVDAELTKLDIELYKFPSKTTKSARH